MRKMKAATLVLDYTLYPRSSVDNYHVNEILEARRAGIEMPPVVIDRASKRVADGFHRILAALKDDPDAEIDVVEKTYKDDAALFLDAMRYNSAHGCGLDKHDRTHCALVAEHLHIPADAVAGALCMSVDKLGALRTGRTATDKTSGLTIPIKQTFKHMHGKKLSKEQLAANDRSSGMNQTFYVNQIIDMIEADLLNKDDEKLLGRLRHLHELLGSMLVV